MVKESISMAVKTVAPTLSAIADDVPSIEAIQPGQSFSFFIVFLAGSFAAAAGVGGGAVYMTLYIILFGLVYEAVPLSKIAVFGTSIAFFFQNILMPVPKSTGHASRFAYDVVMVMEPATLLGTVAGVLASKVFPYWIITIMMTFLLSLSAFKTFSKGQKLYLKENNKRLNQGLHADPVQNLIHPGNGGGYGSIAQEILADDVYGSDIDNSIFRIDWIGWRCILTVNICFICVFVTSYFDSGQGEGDYLVECNSWQFWGLVVLNVIVCGAITVWNVSYLIEHSYALDQSKEAAILWDMETGTKYALLCLVAGFLSALCGIGGSTIKGPILLEMGIHPTLAKATSQFMLLSTVSSSALQFYLQGSLPPNYAIIFFSIAFLASLCGKYGIDRYVEDFGGRQSTIVYLLAWYIVLAAVLMSGIGIIIILGQISPTLDYEQLWFRSICDALPPDVGALKWLTAE